MIKKILVLILSIGFCLSLISKIVAEEKISGFIFWKTKRVGKDSKGNKIVKYYYKSKTSNLKITKILYIELKGEFIVVGSDPFTQLVFQTVDGKNYYIAEKDKNKYNNKQGKKLVLKGQVQVRELYNKKRKKKILRRYFYPND